MGEGFLGVARGIAAVALLVVMAWGCPFPTGQPTGSSVESQDTASPPEVPQQPASDAAPPTADPHPATPRSATSIVTITTPDGALIEYSKDPKTLIIMMRGEHGGERAVWDPTPPLRIYGDGRVDAYGKYESHLTEEEMAELLTFLVRKGVLDFNEQAVNAELDRSDAARGKPLAERYSQRMRNGGPPDSVPTIIEISLDAYKPAGTDRTVIRPFNHRIRRNVIQLGASMYPDVEPVTGLAEADRRLNGVIIKRTIAEGRRVNRQD